MGFGFCGFVWAGGGGRSVGGSYVCTCTHTYVHMYRLVFNREESADEPPVKAVVFSQWTFMLDLVEKALKARGWG